MSKIIYQRVSKLLRAYVRNVFNGKITTLAGVVILVVAIYRMTLKDADITALMGLLLVGLGLLGVKDPTSASSDK
jgi:hypothetical protein